MINLSTLYLAICLVESGNDPGAIGRHGERGAAQISRTVWKQHMNGYGFYRCSDTPLLAKRCALKHLSWLVRNGVYESPFALGYAWNSGLGGFRRAIRTMAPRSSRLYAERVESTYNELLKRKAKR